MKKFTARVKPKNPSHIPDDYKSIPSSSPILEDTTLATQNFPGGRHMMILYAAKRAIQLNNNAVPLIDLPPNEHKSTVIALLEIQAGKIITDPEQVVYKKPE